MERYTNTAGGGEKEAGRNASINPAAAFVFGKKKKRGSKRYKKRCPQGPYILTSWEQKKKYTTNIGDSPAAARSKETEEGNMNGEQPIEESSRKERQNRGTSENYFKEGK